MLKNASIKFIFKTALLMLSTMGILVVISSLTGAIATPNLLSSLSSPTYPSFGVTLPADFEVHGIDVSRHQQNIDWEAVSKMKHNDVSISFVYIKASEGKTISDNYFKQNWRAVKDNGMLRGAYHFYRPHLTAEVQANLFFSQLPKLEKGDLPPVLDIEIKGNTPVSTMRKGLKKWLVMVEKKYGVTPIIYTNYSFHKNYLNTPEFKKYPLWIAHYKTPNLYHKMSNWHFWQHTDRANVNGIRGGVDFNVYKGSLDELKTLCKK
jgi:lysozyme